MAQVAQEGQISRGAHGQLVAHPAIGVARTQAELILRAADRLGMSPSARTRMEVPDQPPASKFDGLLGARPALRAVRPHDDRSSP
jgi:P27 family predicted phage terminase small subunit